MQDFGLKAAMVALIQSRAAQRRGFEGRVVHADNPPTIDDLARIARGLHLDLSSSDLESFRQFDVTGHPAMNVPCGISEGLPVGMMLVGRLGDDATVLRAADAWQRNFGR